MKIVYVSLLSLAIIGQGAYFYYDFQGKKEQMLLTANMIGQVSSRVDQAEHDVVDLRGLYQSAVAHAAEQSAAELRKVLDDRLAELQKRDQKQREAFDARIADMKKDQSVQQAFFDSHEEHVRDVLAQTLADNDHTRNQIAQDNDHTRNQIALDNEQTKREIALDNEQTRKQTEDQTNHILADVRDLRLNTLGRLSDTEIALRDVKLFVGEKADRALKDKIRIQSAKLFNPEAH